MHKRQEMLRKCFWESMLSHSRNSGLVSFYFFPTDPVLTKDCALWNPLLNFLLYLLFLTGCKQGQNLAET